MDVRREGAPDGARSASHGVRHQCEGLSPRHEGVPEHLAVGVAGDVLGVPAAHPMGPRNSVGPLQRSLRAHHRGVPASWAEDRAAMEAWGPSWHQGVRGALLGAIAFDDSAWGGKGGAQHPVLDETPPLSHRGADPVVLGGRRGRDYGLLGFLLRPSPPVTGVRGRVIGQLPRHDLTAGAFAIGGTFSSNTPNGMSSSVLLGSPKSDPYQAGNAGTATHTGRTPAVGWNHHARGFHVAGVNGMSRVSIDVTGSVACPCS